MQEPNNADWILSICNPFENLNFCASGQGRNQLNDIKSVYLHNSAVGLMLSGKLLVALASTVILGSESRWAHASLLV
jgi:hypothetical protein